MNDAVKRDIAQDCLVLGRLLARHARYRPDRWPSSRRPVPPTSG
jgi:hypothetical protein